MVSILKSYDFQYQLQDLRDIKVWNFKDLSRDIITRFKDDNLTSAFNNRVKRLGGYFCCAKGEMNPTSLWYDMLWDVIPHTDK